MTDFSEVISLCEGYGTEGNCDICPANCAAHDNPENKIEEQTKGESACSACQIRDL